MIAVILGQNSFAIEQQISSLIKKFIDSGGEEQQISKIWVDASTQIDDLLIEIQNISIFAPKKMTILRDICSNDELIDKIDNFISAANQDSWLVVLDPSLNKRSKLLKKLPKQTVFLEANQLKAQQLISWLINVAKENQIQLRRPEAEYLLQRVGEDQQQLFAELQKLFNALEEGQNEISRELIQELVDLSPQGSIFAMLDALLKADLRRAIGLYREQLAQGEQPQRIVGMIVWQITQLAIVVDKFDLSPAELTQKYGISSYVLSKLRPVARRLSNQDIQKNVAELRKIDYLSRTKAPVNSAVEYFISYLAEFLQP